MRRTAPILIVVALATICAQPENALGVGGWLTLDLLSPEECQETEALLNKACEYNEGGDYSAFRSTMKQHQALVFRYASKNAEARMREMLTTCNATRRGEELSGRISDWLDGLDSIRNYVQTAEGQYNALGQSLPAFEYIVDDFRNQFPQRNSVPLVLPLSILLAVGVGIGYSAQLN